MELIKIVKDNFGYFPLFNSIMYSISETENQSVKINEIIAVKLDNKSGATEGGKFQHLEMVALSATAFSIHYIKRISRHRYVIIKYLA